MADQRFWGLGPLRALQYNGLGSNGCEPPMQGAALDNGSAGEGGRMTARE